MIDLRIGLSGKFHGMVDTLSRYNEDKRTQSLSERPIMEITIIIEMIKLRHISRENRLVDSRDYRIFAIEERAEGFFRSREEKEETGRNQRFRGVRNRFFGKTEARPSRHREKFSRCGK